MDGSAQSQTSHQSMALTTPHPRPVRSAGLVLLGGAAGWWLGAPFLEPFRGEYYSAPDTRAAIAVVAAHPVAWTLQTLLFFAGAAATTLGLALVAAAQRGGGPWRLALVGVAASAGATSVEAFSMVLRLALPASAIARTGDLSSPVVALLFGAAGAWVYPAFAGLTLTSFLSAGIVLAWGGL